jgi:hypothetical protein
MHGAFVWGRVIALGVQRLWTARRHLRWRYYRFLGPVYRWQRRATDRHIRRYGWHPCDCPWCGHNCYRTVLTHGLAGAAAGPGALHIAQCPRCDYRWQLSASR